MRGAARALRDGFALPARPPWKYGLLCGVAVAWPLFAGVTAGLPHSGAFVALGAYLTAFGDAYGKPYAQRAWNLVVKLVLVAAGAWLGLFLAPYPWWGAVVIGLVAAAGRWKLVGTPPAIAAIVAFYLHGPVGLAGPLEMALGGAVFVLLAMAPWPVRRLDPLRDALGGAREALASLLDGVDLDEEAWGRLRERASKALEGAATASASFHAGEDTTRSADAYVRMLLRVFAETVALRRLRVEAAADRREIDEVVGALTVALRTKAPQDVQAALDAAARFGEHASEVRSRSGADPASLRRVAVLGQVRRCLDRLVVAVRGIGVFAARGIRVPAMPPRVLWKPVVWRPVVWKPVLWRPASLERAWRRGWRGARRWVSRVLRATWRALGAGGVAEHSGRLGIAVTVAMALVIGTHEVYGKWFVITVMLALRSTYGDTVERVVLRVAGTVLGAAVAALILAAVPGPYTIAVTVLVFATVGYALREVSFGYWMVFATPLAMMLADFSTRLDWRAAGARLLLTVAGGLLALAAARLLWPRGEGGRLRGRTAELLEEHASLVDALAERDLDAVLARADAAGQAADELTASLDKLGKEPGGRVPPELREAVTAARKLRDDALVVASVLRGSQVGSDATVAVLDAVADRLAAVAETVRTREPAPEADELEARLAELAGEVSSLMEKAVAKEAAEDVAAEETSAVRRQLRLTVTAHPALRSLCSDALELARKTTEALEPARERPVTA